MLPKLQDNGLMAAPTYLLGHQQANPSQLPLEPYSRPGPNDLYRSPQEMTQPTNPFSRSTPLQPWWLSQPKPSRFGAPMTPLKQNTPSFPMLKGSAMRAVMEETETYPYKPSDNSLTDAQAAARLAIAAKRKRKPLKPEAVMDKQAQLGPSDIRTLSALGLLGTAIGATPYAAAMGIGGYSNGRKGAVRALTSILGAGAGSGVGAYTAGLASGHPLGLLAGGVAGIAGGGYGGYRLGKYLTPDDKPQEEKPHSEDHQKTARFKVPDVWYEKSAYCAKFIDSCVSRNLTNDQIKSAIAESCKLRPERMSEWDRFFTELG